MGLHAPARDELPAEFAVFPLPGALLLPHGRLPLNIFEPRYLAMVEDCLGEGRVFGMVQPNGHEPSAEGPDLYSIGCLGRLSHFSETEDGRYLITLTGVARFRIQQELPQRRGYRRVRGDFTAFLADLAAPGGEQDLRKQEVLAALRPFFALHRIDANWDALARMPSSMLVTTLAMLCPFDDAEKQALLEAPTDADRAGDLLTLLRMSVHESALKLRPS